MAAPAALAADYSTLLARVGHYLFGIRTGYSADQIADIEECIKDGLHDVYTAHSWSFFRPVEEISTTAPYGTGTITIAAGVATLTDGVFPAWAASGVLRLDNSYYDVDTRDGDTQITLHDTSVTQADDSSYELGRAEYDLPTGFDSIETRLFYQPGQSDFYPPVKMRHDSYIRSRQQDDPYTNRPIYFSIRTVEFDPTVGSRKRISFYPIADAAYVMKARMNLRPTMIDETNLYPVGGESLAQLITEACLSAAERGYDEREHVHSKQFSVLLPLAIQADQLASSPTQLGSDSSKGENADLVSRMGTLTFNDVVL